MGLPDTAYTGPKLAEDPRYGRSNGISHLAKTLVVYDRSEPGAARAIIMAGSDLRERFEIVFARNAGISITRRGAKSDVDSDCSDKVKDSV